MDFKDLLHTCIKSSHTIPEGLNLSVIKLACTLNLTHLGQSQSGRSRGWSPHCPCVSSPPPLGCPGLQHCCLPSAAPAGAGGASARAPETPAGTGSSSLSLQVSSWEKEKRKWFITYTESKQVREFMERLGARQWRNIEEIRVSN